MRTPPVAIRQPRAARLSPLAAALALVFALAPAAHAITITVTSDADSGAGTLRDAILAANTACDTGVSSVPVINFSGPFTIAPSSPLPTFFCGSAAYDPTVDGGGTPSDPRVVLDGAGSGASCGLNSNVNPLYGGTLTVLGMNFEGFTYGGGFAAGVCGTSITLKGNLFTRNSIGTWLTGGTSTVGGLLTTDRNVFATSPGKGLQVSGASATIENNVFTGNSDTGIYISGGSATIEGNLVGTANGTSASGNGTGIFLNSVGSALIGSNLISGNSGVGVDIYGDSGGAFLYFNQIGTNAAGTGALPNSGGGIVVRQSSFSNLSDNLVSGNGGAGVSIDNSYSIYLARNRIGSTASGAALANTRGVDAFCSGYLDLSNNTIATNRFEGIYFGNVDQAYVYGNTIEDNGGTGLRIAGGLDCFQSGSENTLDSNTIRDNRENGVLLTGGTGNGIFAGSITGNALKNININDTGSSPLPNDPGDGDGGPNNQQNYPLVDSVVQSGGQTIIDFTLDSGFSTYTIQAYANSALGKAGGETYLGTMSICGDCSVFSGTFTFDGLYDNISLTASDGGNTSEFSPMKSATTAPAVLISRATVSFGNVEIETDSAARAVTVLSIGDQPYVIDQIGSGGSCYGGPICYGGEFTCSTTCTTGTEYAKGVSCRFTAAFTPSFPGFQTTSIFLCDNTAGSPNQIVLEGNAVLPPPIRISPTLWDFGDVEVGATSAARGFTITNTTGPYGGSIPVIIGITGEFDIVSNSCGKSVPADGSCNVSVQFGPTQSGAARGDLSVTIDGCGVECATVAVALPNPTAKAALLGNGVEGGALKLPEAVDVGAANFGGGAVSRTVELRNSGTSPVTFSSVEVSSLFTLLNNCPAVLEAGQSCTLVIGFTAPGIGPFTGTLTVVSDASGGSAEIPLSAVGQTSAAPLLRLEPNSIGFGDRVIGSQSSSQLVTIRNIGGAVATLNLAISTIDFTLSGNTCSATLEPQGSCFAQVAFRPLGFGQRTGALIVNSNAVGNPQAVSLGGTGCRPFVASGNRSGSSSNCAP